MKFSIGSTIGNLAARARYAHRKISQDAMASWHAQREEMTGDCPPNTVRLKRQLTRLFEKTGRKGEALASLQERIRTLAEEIVAAESWTPPERAQSLSPGTSDGQGGEPPSEAELAAESILDALRGGAGEDPSPPDDLPAPPNGEGGGKDHD